MAKESTLSETEKSRSQSPEPSQNNGGDRSEDSRQDTFASTFSALSDIFSRACEELNIQHAVLIANDGKHPPLMFSRTDLLTTAMLLAHPLRELKSDIDSALSTEPIRST